MVAAPSRLLVHWQEAVVSLKESVVSGVISGSIVALATAFVGVQVGKQWQEQAAYLNPSCDSPHGLRQVPPGQLTASDDVPGREPGDLHLPIKVLDGYTGSIWVPTRRPKEAGESSYVPYFGPSGSTLTLTLKESADVRLICVNNGLGSGDPRYENWGKSRTLRVWKDDSPDAAMEVALMALPVELSESLQEGGHHLGEARSDHLQVMNAYAGEANTSYDPDVCKKVIERALRRTYPDDAERGEDVNHFVDRRFTELYAVKDGAQPQYEPGCLEDPAVRAGLSEVVLYEKNPKDPAPRWINLLRP